MSPPARAKALRTAPLRLACHAGAKYYRLLARILLHIASIGTNLEPGNAFAGHV